jgi:hypothetical protein
MTAKCVNCNKKKKVKSRGLCAACYSRWYRSTDKGREAMNTYNHTAGKEATKRYLDKLKRERPPRPPKPDCECGNPSVSKGYCMPCYQRNYRLRKNGGKVSNGKRGGQTVYNPDDLFQKILSEVKRGLNISTACDKHKVHRSTLYKIISPAQKAELKACKLIGAVSDEDDFF